MKQLRYKECNVLCNLLAKNYRTPTGYSDASNGKYFSGNCNEEFLVEIFLSKFVFGQL